MKKNNPKISIITVTYNSEKFLVDCLNSVALQDYTNIEHIIIDGKSTDGTLSILKSRVNQFSHLISERDQGIYDAMNKGISLANGDIICFLNSDDVFFNNSIISRVAEIFKNNYKLQACHADSQFVDRAKIFKAIKRSKYKNSITENFFREWLPEHTTFFVRRSVYEKFGKFDLNYKIASDMELMMRFMKIHKIKTQYFSEIWTNVRIGGRSNRYFFKTLSETKNIMIKYGYPKINVYFNFYFSTLKSIIKFFLKKN